MVTWINTKGFVHLVDVTKKYGEHFKINTNKKIIEPVKESGFLISKELILDCENVKSQCNIYQ